MGERKRMKDKRIGTEFRGEMESLIEQLQAVEEFAQEFDELGQGLL